MLSAFIYVLFLFAGVGQAEGRVAVGLLVIIGLVQAINSAPELAAFFARHPTSPQK